MSDCNKCLSKDTCEAAFNNDSCSHFKDSICKYCEKNIADIRLIDLLVIYHLLPLVVIVPLTVIQNILQELNING
jgi:hypothetical protein